VTKKILAAILLSMFMVSCASDPSDLQTTYVNPSQFASYDCQQIENALTTKNNRLSSLYTTLQNEANADKWQTGVGLLLFWPTLFFLEGNDGPEATEYRRLKGEVEALGEAANRKKCGFS
jgi:hypothetical protein